MKKRKKSNRYLQLIKKNKKEFLLYLQLSIIFLGLILCAGLLLHSLLVPPSALEKGNSGLNTDVQSGQGTDASAKTHLKSKEMSYYLINRDTNEVLSAYLEEKKRAPASTTKLLTGITALKLLTEDDFVVVGPEVNLTGTNLGLHPGDKITVRNLLTAIFLASANDASAALAVKASGSISAFSEAMNTEAQSLGCKNSHFTSPHGLTDPAQYTTAKDLAKITSTFINNDQLMKYVQQTEATIRWIDANGNLRTQQVRNKNKLLGVYPGIQGLKTGTTNEAGQCLVTYDVRSDGKLLLVLLGSDQRYRDTVQLLDEGWAKLRIQAALKTLVSDPEPLLSGPGIFSP
jgi:D-alanyl-D-alanine carboxypeptidase (penicillin-binding protein 5/6)